jgi:hypothetical protein
MRVTKFPILILKKISSSLSAVLIAGSLVAIWFPTAATALAPVGSANPAVTTSELLPTSLGLATINGGLPGDTSASAIAVPASTTNTATQTARSIGLVAANLDSATLTATVRTSGVLSLYVLSGTTVAFTASGGTFATAVALTAATKTADFNSTGGATSQAITYSATQVAHTISVLYTAPSTAGTYYLYARSAKHSTGSGVTVPTSTLATAGAVIGGITITVSDATSTHPAVGGTNAVDISGATNTSLFTAVASNSGITGVVHPTTTIGVGEATALSKGLLSKDNTVSTAQTATILTGGVMSLYGVVNTAVAFSASGGTFSGSVGMAGTAAVTYGSSNSTTLLTGMTPVTGSTTVATLWTAPSTVGTYTINMLTGFPQDANASTYSIPTTSSLPTTLGAKITVTVVATSGGGTYSAVYSACNTATTTAAVSSTYPTGIDSTGRVADGGAWYIDFDLDDAYDANLDPGNIVVSATNGALVNIGTSSGTAPAAGTASTDTSFSSGSGHTVIITQPTAGAPLTTTVTITYNGTTVCTKTVTIRGKVASLEIGNVGTGSLSSQDGSSIWIESNAGTITGLPAGLFTVIAKDSAGNIVSTPTTLGSYGSVASTLTTTVQAVSVTTRSTTSSSTDNGRYNVGTWLCGSSAGEANVKIKFTTTATGEVVESPAFKARCADSPYTFTVALDKASYQLGDLVTATVQFLDSKGFKANSVAAPGASTWTMPMLTAVDYASSATAVTKADGTMVYKWTVGGTNTAATAGTYTGVISYTGLTASTNATPTYKITSASADVPFSDILKSVVALIASINKQIQALQKLILKSRK